MGSLQYYYSLPGLDGSNAHDERPSARSEDGHPLLVETDMDSNLYYYPTNPKWADEHLAKMHTSSKMGVEKQTYLLE